MEGIQLLGVSTNMSGVYLWEIRGQLARGIH